MASIEETHLPLSLLVGAAICFYGGIRFIWRGFGEHRPRHSLLRGMIAATPIGIIGLFMAFTGRAGMGVSIVMSGGTLLLTLALGAGALSCQTSAGIGSASLRLLAPLCVATFVIGLSGELSLLHALALSGMAIALLWSRDRAASCEGQSVRMDMLSMGGLLMAGGVGVMILAIMRLLELPIVPLIGPVVVPLCFLAAIGLLVGDIHAGAGTQACDTIAGGVLLLIGFALPLVIVTARVAAVLPSDLPVSDIPVVIMPLATWRIDSVLLSVISILLLPAGMGRFALGRLEGLMLVLACVFYMLVTVATARG